MPGKSWKRNLKPLQPPAEPPNLSFLVPTGAILIFWICAQIWTCLTNLLDRIPKSVPAEIAWADRVEADDGTADSKALAWRPTVGWKEQVRAAPPKGRCFGKEDCRSTGICVIEYGKQAGICGECRLASDCPAEEVCQDSFCGDCQNSGQCPGVLLCRSGRCEVPDYNE